MPFRAKLCVWAGPLLVALLIGCGGAPRGKLIDGDSVPKSQVVLDRALTSEVDGLEVLWNGQVFGRDFKHRGYIAGNRSQFGALWKKVNVPKGEPVVDFAKYVVLAVSGGGGICPQEVLAVELGAQSVLRVRTIQPRPGSKAQVACPDVLVRRALIVAVPRSLLGSSILFVEEKVFKFSIPKIGEPAEQRPRPPAARSSLIVPWGEAIQLPDRGSISLRTLSNGAQVWVAHQSDGTVDVLSSIFWWEDPVDRYDPPQWAVLSYSQDWGRFFGGYDTHGKNAHGLPPIQSFSWTRVESDHVALKAPLLPRRAPMQSPDLSPTLVGEARAYGDVPLVKWSDVPDGHVAQVDMDLVTLPHRSAELCEAPDPSASLKYFVECPAGSPTAIGVEAWHRFATPDGWIDYGPFVVQRQGQNALVLARGERGSGPRWLTAPPERQCPLRARKGQYPGYRIEWTFKDGPDALQEVCGGPKQTITFTSAILQGDGTEQVGDALRRELEPRLAKIAPVYWNRACAASAFSVNPGAKNGENAQCHADEFIEVIGEYLRERNASDRVVVMMPLSAAPAIRGQ